MSENKAIADAQDELLGLLEGKISKLKSQRKYIRVRGNLVRNDKTIVDPQTGKKITDLEDK